MAAIHTLGELRRSSRRSRPVKQEIRDNLVRKLQTGEMLFPGIIGYDDSVIPQLVNAILSKHNFILLGLRGQAKSRILRGLVDLLDNEIPVVPGCEMHYGLLPRANAGIFAINELPDLAGKIQVGLFNILQEGDVQIKGYPIRLKLDVLLVFTANPEDYTARGKIITPLKDRIGSEIRTHYPATRHNAMAITAQEAWTERTGTVQVEIPPYVREVVEEVAFQARADRKIDKRTGVSQRLPITTIELVVSNAERRALQ